MANIKIKHKDEQYEYEKGTTLLDIAKDFKKDYESEIIAALVNNRLVSLETKMTRSGNVEFLDATNPLGNRTYVRGLYFLFIKAVKDVLNCDVKIMHLVGNGVYCEILTNNLISEVTVEKIKLKMRDLVEEKLPITKITVSRLDAIDYFTKVNQPDKAESLRFISNSSISLYKLDDTLDYFYGVLPISTGFAKLYEIVKYHNGILIRYPNRSDINKLPEFEENKKLLETLDEYEDLHQTLHVQTLYKLNRIIKRNRIKIITIYTKLKG